MPKSDIDRAPSYGDHLLQGHSRPGLAVVVFVSAFLFAALPFGLNADSVPIVAPSVIASFTCSILFVRLMIGELGMIKWILLGLSVAICIIGGREWYLGVLLTFGTILCILLAERAIGPFVPLVRMPKR